MCGGRGKVAGIGDVSETVVRSGHRALWVAKATLLGEGKCNILVEDGDWSVFWSGEDVGCHQGVGLLISPKWKHAMLSFD